MGNEIVVKLSASECCAIAARAEVERMIGEPRVWLPLWKKIEPQLSEEDRPLFLKDKKR